MKLFGCRLLVLLLCAPLISAQSTDNATSPALARNTSEPAVPATSAATPQISATTSMKQHLVGVWRLVSTEQTTPVGETHPNPNFGAHAVGFLIYTSDGIVCLQMMNPDRPHPTSDRPVTGPELTALVDGFASFCGTWEVNQKDSIMIHRAQTAWNPSLLGGEMHRPFILDGDRLIFTSTNALTGIVSTITWQRAK